MTEQAPSGAQGPVSSGPAPTETSVELLRRARGGESQALDLLLERYLPPFRAWASRRLPPWAREGLDTDDLVQEALLHTIQHVNEFEPRRDGALQAYMRQAVRNRVRDAVRRSRRHARAVTLDSRQPAAGPSPLQTTLGVEAFERYEAALDRLSDTDREAVLARVELKQSWEVVARVLDKPSANAARMAVGRALRRLAEEMER